MSPSARRSIRLAAVTVALLPGLASAARANDARITAEQRTGPRAITLTIWTPAFTAPTKVDVDLPAAYDKEQQDAAMHRFLARIEHLPMKEAFIVLDRYWKLPQRGAS